MKIIAICGQKGTGKDLVANIIANQLSKEGRIVRKIEFGNPIKDIICAAFKLKNHQEYQSFVYGVVKLENGKKLVGKEIVKAINMRMRQANCSQFIDAIEDQIMLFKGYHPEQFDKSVFVITDLRFKDELKWCKKKSVPIVKVKRLGSVSDPYSDQPDIDDYFCDYIINNDREEKDLEVEIKQILQDVMHNE